MTASCFTMPFELGYNPAYYATLSPRLLHLLPRPNSLHLLLLPLQHKLPLAPLQRLINAQYRQTNHQHRPPLVPIQWCNLEQTLQKRCVQQDKVQRHGQRDSVDEHHVAPQREGEQGFGGREGVHGV